MRNYTINEGYNSLGKALLMMNYDSKKTLTENLQEETPSVTLQMKPLKVDLSPEDQHIIRQALGFVLYFGGPVGKVLSVAIDLADAKKYYNEGNNIMALMTAAFSVIPAGETIFSGAKFISEIRRTPNFIKNLSNKILQGGEKLTNLEKQVINWFTTNKSKVVSRISSNVNRLTLTKYLKELKSNFSKNLLIKFLNFLYKTIGKPLSKLVIKLGTISITIDVLYDVLIGKENRENETRVISSLQKRLKQLGYGKYLGNTGPNKDGVDGDFGQKTINAVTAFQTKNGIKSEFTGLVDEKTAEKLGIEYGIALRDIYIKNFIDLQPEEVVNSITSDEIDKMIINPDTY